MSAGLASGEEEMALCGPPVPVAGIIRIRFNGYDLSRRTIRQHPMAYKETLLLWAGGCKGGLGLGLCLCLGGALIDMDEILPANGGAQGIIALNEIRQEFMQAFFENLLDVDGL